MYNECETEYAILSQYESGSTEYKATSPGKCPWPEEKTEWLHYLGKKNADHGLKYKIVHSSEIPAGESLYRLEWDFNADWDGFGTGSVRSYPQYKRDFLS